MRSVVVREYARLTTSPLAQMSLDEAHVPDSAFEWLCKESARLRQSGASLVQLEDRRWLRLDNYVGVLETPCGTRIEILPKCVEGMDDEERARRLLRKMLARCLNLPTRETGPTHIQTFSAPLTEWVMGQFLSELDRLVKRGVRFDYRSVQEQQRFLRGRLDVDRQLRQPPGRQHLFHIEHDVFDADRPENRLLRTALDRVCRITRDPSNWRLSHELATFLAPVPTSKDMASDFRRWRDDRLMAHYRPARPWCSLILNEQTPMSILGEWYGASLLFPMERVFERYVEACLRRMLPPDAVLTPSASSRYLCSHKGESWFLLKPDFLVQRGQQRVVLDTKWKRLDESFGGNGDKYGLSQSDFYQLFAYGQRYLDGKGTLVLVYPRTATFQAPLDDFVFDAQLRLVVAPFDLEEGRLAVDALPWEAGFSADAA
ncbi:McrC family protein [Arenimonas donghaensis]|uniref:Restriction endonuclease n=1 Tax=Arenimonas donghaensis DSM 18148 = HO3-R19 TaxID=1121014 RepID=A0A087MK24_9GAMM|nr:McrC family protein [Arenimonas donghaensis]KFL37227.1 hypothetical protein N788_10330 [Arenimonas donghaensis DSM 18148 = HO3-R19]